MSNQINHGLTNSLRRDVSGRSVASVLQDRNLQQVLGYGSNCQIRINGQIASADRIISYGETLDIETVANRKANNVSVTLRHGPNNELVRSVPAGTTVQSILTNSSFRSVLGFGANSIARIDGALISDTNLTVREGMVIDIETAANQKARR